MELILVIVGYTAILTVCYFIGEHLGRGRWITPTVPTDNSDRDKFAKEEPAPQSEKERASEEQPPSDTPPLEAEVLPNPEQVVRELGEQIEGFARNVAKEFGVELGEFATYSSVSKGEKGGVEFVDLEER